jgi:predicted nucleotidyltransferase
MKRNKLISLALSFASFLIERIEVKAIILFGSVARNTFDEESDIDLFIDTDKKNDQKIKDVLEFYKKTPEYEKFKLEGIENEISIKAGRLEEWKDLKRSIISGGIVLLGNYEGAPNKLKHKIIFLLNVENLKRSEKIKFWRKIYGYKQKIGERVYSSKGFSEKKLGRGSFMVSDENLEEVVNYLKKNKIKYSFFDIWVEGQV